MASIVLLDLLASRRMRDQWRRSTVLLLPGIAYCLWQVHLLRVWGQVPLLASPHAFDVPLYAFASFLFYMAFARVGIYLSQLLLLIAFIVVVGFAIRSSIAGTHLTFSWILYGAMALSMTEVVWANDVSFLRVLSEFYTLGTLIVIGSNQRARRWTLACLAAVWLVLVLRHIASSPFLPVYQL